MSQKVVAVAGATGMVGRQMLLVLEERDFPVKSLKPLASERSKGKTVTFKGEEIPVQVLTEDSFKGVDIALFSAGGGTSKHFAPFAAKDGCVVIDNSSAWRMDPKVPLVVPEVNPDDVGWHEGIIANPNCSTIQMVVVLKPLHDAATITRVVVSTYQSVSGAGKEGMDELWEQTKAVMREDILAEYTDEKYQEIGQTIDIAWTNLQAHASIHHAEEATAADEDVAYANVTGKIKDLIFKAYGNGGVGTPEKREEKRENLRDGGLERLIGDIDEIVYSENSQ